MFQNLKVALTMQPIPMFHGYSQTIGPCYDDSTHLYIQPMVSSRMLANVHLPSATLGGLLCGRGFKLPGFSRSSAVTHLIGTAAFATSSAGPL